jgi:hypothetical protein
MRHRMLALAILALAAPLVAQEDSYRNGRIRHLEGGVLVQRADEGASEEAAPNMPFLPGDRIWTDGGGRAELQFDDGSSLRLDGGSKMDYMGDDRRDSVLLKLWSGSLFLHARPSSAGFTIDTPGGVVEVVDHSVVRVDVESGETRLSVLDGEATLESGHRRVTVEAGERSYARRAYSPERPRRFDRQDQDDFARWDAEREDRIAYAGDSRRYLPDDVLPYAGELESSGSWYYESEIGYVWRPYVGPDWRPYYNGRWVWTAYGWTWIPNETWGWAPFHYGRWGYSASLGWYWIPSSGWGPAWVQWASGGDYVGWCPLGYRNKPIVVFDKVRGHAGPRSGAAAAPPPSSPRGGSTANAGVWLNGENGSGKGWIFSRRGDLNVLRERGKWRLDATPAQIQAKVFDSPQVRPTRDLRNVAETHGVIREGKTKPVIGDWVPELRSNPATTIPHPAVVQPSGEREPNDSRSTGTVTPADRRRPETTERSSGWLQQERRREDGSSTRSRPTTTSGESRERERGNDDRRREPQTAKPADPDREILRRFFEPVSEPRKSGGERDGGGRGTVHDGDERRGGSERRGGGNDGASGNVERMHSQPRNEPRNAPPPRVEPARPAPPPQAADKPKQEHKKDH